MNTLVILAHPALHRSRINSRLADIARQQADTEVVDLYESYPDFEIHVATEQQRLLWADTIVLQHPLYWYATPALLKEWIDLVFQHGFAYGDGTKKLTGKLLTQAISTGGDADSYTPNGFNKVTIDELVLPMKTTANFCGMRWEKPFLTQGGHVITDDVIHSSCDLYATWLSSLATHKEPL